MTVHHAITSSHATYPFWSNGEDHAQGLETAPAAEIASQSLIFQ